MIKWCIIGAGGIADRRTIPAILSDSNNEIVALMEKNTEIGKKVAQKYGIKCYDDEEEMFKNVDCDCVYIGTPVFCHYEQALLALKYNKNVFVEKPITLSVQQGKDLISAFKKAGKQLSVGYMMKYHNLHEKAKALIKKGEIGKVNDVRLQFSCWYPDIESAWRQKKSLGGGGAFMDLGVHCVELIEYVLGDEIVDVKGFFNTQTFSYEVEDSAVMVFKTKRGVLGHIDVNFNIPDNASVSKMEIYGTEGYIICNGTLGQEETGKMLYLQCKQGDYVAAQNRVSDKPKTYNGKKGNLYLKQIQAFCKLINSGKLSYTYANKAVHIQELVEKFYQEK